MTHTKKIMLAAAAALVLLAAAGAGLWAYMRANEVCLRRIVLDDASLTIRLETVSRNGKIRELRREKWVKDNLAQRRKVACEMRDNASYVNEWAIRVDENAKFSDVYDCFLEPIGMTDCMFEAVKGDGEISRVPCAVASHPDEDWGATMIAIDVHNQKRLSRFLHADIDSLRESGSAEWAACLKAHGVRVKVICPESLRAEGRKEVLLWWRVFSRYTSMADVAAANSKLSALGMEYRRIRFMELKPALVETPEERE